MVTVLILWDGEEESLKKTEDSLRTCQNSIAKSGAEIVWRTIQTDSSENEVSEELTQVISEIQSEFVTLIRAGETYQGDALVQGCECLRRLGGQTDGVALENTTRKIRRKGRGQKLSCQIYSLTDLNELMLAPADFAGIILRTDAVRGMAIDFSYGAGWLESLVCRILLKKKKLGYAKGARFVSCSPLTDAGVFRKEWGQSAWYRDLAENYCLALLGQTAPLQKMTGGEDVPLFLQAQVLYALKIQFQVNMDHTDKGALHGADLERYYEICRKCLAKIDSRLLFAERVHEEREILPQICGVFARMKYEADSRDGLADIVMPVMLQLMEYEDGVLRLDGAVDSFLLADGRQFQVRLDGKALPCYFPDRYAAVFFFGKEFERKAFHIEIPLQSLGRKNTLRFVLQDKGAKELPLSVISMGYQAKIADIVKGSYWCFARYMVSFQRKGSRIEAVSIRRAGQTARILQELSVLLRMPFGQNRSRKMFLERIRYWMAYPKYSGKNIWLTFDKLYKGGDCGEYFYKYMVNRKDPDVTPAYVIKADAPDRKRLEKEGYVPLRFGSREQKLSYLYARMIFATHSSVHAFNGYNAWEIRYIQDRLRAVNTCIQHGLSVQNLEADSNRIVNNNKRYYCASRCEIENLSRPEYDYGKETLRLTGIPRYDGLVNDDRRQILITPTWRSYIAMTSVMGAARPYNPEFKNTEYFRIFEELLSDEQLLETARRTGYKVIYLLHPVISAQKKDFTAHEGIELLSALETDYETILTQSSLMVTDYSGVQFDFAYMRKSVVYYHPPTLPPHYTGGGFDYEMQGFGEICTQKDALVELLCGYMEQGCALKPFYRARQDEFFAFDDRESCRRIYEDARAYQDARGCSDRL